MLLSATPYKMYTLARERETDDHYADFLSTTEFLLQGTNQDFKRELQRYRRTLLTLRPETLATARTACDAIEARLRNVMVRTERLAATPNRQGMLKELQLPPTRLSLADLKAYLAYDRIAQHLDAGDVLEYWKSAPYLLNFMERSYKLGHLVGHAIADGSAHPIASALLDPSASLPAPRALESWGEFDMRNPRLRSITEDSIGRGAWRLLWLPPALSYYEPQEPFDDPALQAFTKRLIFSAWKVVPKSIASLGSYEAERNRVGTSARARYMNTAEERSKVQQLLRWNRTKGRIQGLSMLPLVYPSFELGRIGDPLASFIEKGRQPSHQMLREVAERINEALKSLVALAPAKGPVDESWYWAAPILLDRAANAAATDGLLSGRELAEIWGAESDDEQQVMVPTASEGLEVGIAYDLSVKGEGRAVFAVAAMVDGWVTIRSVLTTGRWRKNGPDLEKVPMEDIQIHGVAPAGYQGPMPETLEPGHYYGIGFHSRAHVAPFLIQSRVGDQYTAVTVWRNGRTKKVEHGAAQSLLASSINEAAEYDSVYGDGALPAGVTADVMKRALSVGMNPDQLGRPPENLVSVLARVAVASPATCALRALARMSSGQLDEEPVRLAAARVAWSFRNLFNLPDVIAMLQHESRDVYWRACLSYCLAGNIQSVLDEYGHVLPEWLGLLEKPPDETASKVADAMSEAISLRAVPYAVDHIVDNDGDGLAIDRRRMRGRFALRFGDDRTEDELDSARTSHVRTAFNSPFWPFILATTSVGQEGLDFHLYCHAVVHWNLPANPVDMEQREGRVHRYKGHAVRKNLATRFASSLDEAQGDPWRALFERAHEERPAGENDLFPFWVLPLEGGASIERYVPMLPLSREVSKMHELRRTLAAYRMVFGQARQDDLVAFLQARFTEQQLEDAIDELRIDLTPPGSCP
ncbi:MAG: helicase-related protein [Actinomycetota bacterium]